MLFIVTLLMVAAVYFVQRAVYKKYAFRNIGYKVSLDQTEVSVGDDLYMYEELTNDKPLPVPYIKVSTNLPVGLAFRLAKVDGGRTVESFVGSLESMFVLKGRQRIRRRWRVNCKKRGIYSLGDVTLVSNDLIGFEPISLGIHVEKRKDTTVTVLPSPVDLEREFSSVQCYSGDILSKRSLLTDPMLRRGVREYTDSDPMNRINWKQTAAHGRLMVNVEEFMQKLQSNVILNMCSQIIERSDDTPGNPEFIEYNITVAASLLERFANDNVPVRLIANTPPETLNPDYIAGSDEVGQQIMMTPPFVGKFGVLDAMRTLATLEMKFSMPVEKLLDYAVANPRLFAENGNIIFVTAVLDGRMLVFHEQMKKLGIEVIFYVTTSNRGVTRIPDDIKVFWRTWFDSYKVVGSW